MPRWGDVMVTASIYAQKLERFFPTGKMLIYRSVCRMFPLNGFYLELSFILDVQNLLGVLADLHSNIRRCKPQVFIYPPAKFAHLSKNRKALFDGAYGWSPTNHPLYLPISLFVPAHVRSPAIPLAGADTGIVVSTADHVFCNSPIWAICKKKIRECMIISTNTDSISVKIRIGMSRESAFENF